MTDWSAPKLLETTGGYWQACAIMAAIELDLFDSLDAEPDTSAGLAERIKVDPRALGMLLRALAALDLLSVEEGIYTPSLASKAFLVSDSEQYMGNIISHQHHLIESWARLHEAVQNGQPVRKAAGFSEEAWRKSFLLGMQNLANLIAPQLIPRIDIGKRRLLLDLGGGPGAWSIHFCRHHPQLQARVFDLPTSKPHADKAIKDARMDDRIRFIGGNFHEHPLKTRTYDLVWASHILHAEGEEECRELLHKTADALKPGGLMMIHEFILDDEGPGPAYASLFALNMLLGTEKGMAYREGELISMLQDAGFREPQRLPLPPHSRSGVIVAHKP